MRKRTFVFKWRKAVPDGFNGDVRSTVDVGADGVVYVTTQLHDDTSASAATVDQFDAPAGRILSWPTPRGTRRYEYVYPSGHGHPTTFRTVKEAAQEAASYAADIFARRLFGKAPQAVVAHRTISVAFTEQEARDVLGLLDTKHEGKGSLLTAAIAVRDGLTARRATDDDPRCGSCGHPTHWRECQGKTIGVISGWPIACQCRRRGPHGDAPPTEAQRRARLGLPPLLTGPSDG